MTISRHGRLPVAVFANAIITWTRSVGRSLPPQITDRYCSDKRHLLMSSISQFDAAPEIVPALMPRQKRLIQDRGGLVAG